VPITIPILPGSTTHCTDGLLGYPALDIGGAVGEVVLAPDDGTVSRVHLIPWGGKVGGWTLYFTTARGAYFLTHLADAVSAGQYGRGAVLGHLADPVANGGGWTFVHVHVGATFWPNPSGQDCGTAVVVPPGLTGELPGSANRPFPADRQTGPVGPIGKQNTLPIAWTHFTKAMAITIPTQMRRARVASRGYKRKVQGIGPRPSGLVGPVGGKK